MLEPLLGQQRREEQGEGSKRRECGGKGAEEGWRPPLACCPWEEQPAGMRSEGQLVTRGEVSPGRALQGKTESERSRQVTEMTTGSLGAWRGPGPC